MISSSTNNRLSAEVTRQAQMQGDIDKLSLQVSSQKKLQTASDDPAAAVRLSQVRREQANQVAYTGNIDTASTLATRVDSALGSVNTALNRALELTTQASSDTYSTEQRASAAAELRQLAQTVAATAVQKDARGQDMFPAGAVTPLPVGDGVTVSGTLPRGQVFDGVATGGTTRSIVDILNDAATAAESGDAASRSAALTAVGDASNHIVAVQATQGVEAKRIDDIAEGLNANGLVLSDERNKTEGLSTTELAAAITLVNSKMTSLQVAQSVFGKIHEKNLFDVLR